ncbi:ABC transporter substrate-binding protein [Kitasatospora sp. NPDC050543]|uniref:ABC transporter substrate-binding protein n=1 Tax=Kitasatospora sp. NPDC050543 TaxID=3364054 RepID=UPI00379811DA
MHRRTTPQASGHRRGHRSMPTVAALTTATALLLSACGGNGGEAKKDPAEEVRGKVPQAMRAAGVLKIGSDLNYAPVEFRGSDGKPQGLDPDIAEALGKVLNLRIEIVDTPFDKLLPSLENKQFDVAMSAISDTRQRREGTDDKGKPVTKGVDFVDYFIAGTSMLVQKGNPKNIRTLDDLCGMTVSLQQGTTQDEIIDRQVGACTRLGKPLQVHKFDSDGKAMADVVSGAAVAVFNDFPVAAYAAKTVENGNRFQVTGSQSASSPYGIAVSKTNTEVRDMMAKAVDQLIRSGEYDKILAKWNVSAGAAQAAVINGGI